MSKKYLKLFWDLRQYKAMLYRIYINIFGIFPGFNYLPLSIDKKGIWFWYKGDEVYYLFKKKGDYRYVSLLCEGYFESLKEMDEFWDEYVEACRKGIKERDEFSCLE